MGNKIILLAVFVAMALLVSFTRSASRKKILFFGDSITQAGVDPGGYIRLLDSMARESGSAFEMIGAGISGNKVYDLYLRMETDVLAKQPDLVVIYIGVNDVWHKQLTGTGTDYDRFGRFYQAIVNRLQSAGIRVIVCTPAVIGERTDNSNPQDGDLNHYSNWIRGFAAGSKIPLADLRKAFIDYNLIHNRENKEKGILTTDRVHLNAAGNRVVAGEIWKAIREVYPQ